MLETKISGIVVATLTIVAPMIKVGMPDTSAIQLAASTNQSPPLTTKMMPSASRMIYAAMPLPSIMDSVETIIIPLPCAFYAPLYNSIFVQKSQDIAILYPTAR